MVSLCFFWFWAVFLCRVFIYWYLWLLFFFRF
jgi:hypothetical protein